MKNGNISNRPTPTILIRMDSSMFRELPRETLKQKFLYFTGKRPKYTMVKPMISFLNYLAVKTEYNVNLVYLNTDKDYENKVKLLDKHLLCNFNVLELNKEMLDGLLDYTECYLVGEESYRNKSYTLAEAYKIFGRN